MTFQEGILPCNGQKNRSRRDKLSPPQRRLGLVFSTPSLGATPKPSIFSYMNDSLSRMAILAPVHAVVVPPVEVGALPPHLRLVRAVGVTVARLTFMIPLVTANKMYLKCIVAPLTSTSQQIMASTVPDIARSLAP
jgi:hypothetical protein